MRQFMPLALLLLLTSCNVRAPRPGSIDQLDSQTYDTLLIAQSLLDNTKIAIQQEKLPESAKAIVNEAGAQYNTLRDTWLLYRATPSTDLATRVTQAALKMSELIAKLRGLK